MIYYHHNQKKIIPARLNDVKAQIFISYLFSRSGGEEQKLKVDEAFEKLEIKQKEIMDSIYYARRIQRALLTQENYFTKCINKRT